jgi:hypothetical protein
LETDAFLKMGNWQCPCKFSFEFDNKIKTKFIWKEENYQIYPEFDKFWKSAFKDGVSVPTEIRFLVGDRENTFLSAYILNLYFGEYYDETGELEWIVEWVYEPNKGES